MRQRGHDWRYRAWREAELPLLVDDPACVRTTELAVAEADPAVVIAAPADDVMERLEPKMRRVIHARANAGDEKGMWRALEDTLRVVVRDEPLGRFVAAVPPRGWTRHRNAYLVYGLLHDRIDLAAVTLSRERVSQLIAGTLFRWGRARFPALFAWLDGERRRVRRVAARRAARRWRRDQARYAREPEPASAPYVPPAWMQGAASWCANAAREEVPNPHDWLRILSRVRPVSLAENLRRAQELRHALEACD